MTPAEILKAAEKDFHVPTGNVTTREVVEWVEKKSLVARPQKDLTLALLRAELERVEGEKSEKYDRRQIKSLNEPAVISLAEKQRQWADGYNTAITDHANYIKSQIKEIERI